MFPLYVVWVTDLARNRVAPDCRLTGKVNRAREPFRFARNRKLKKQSTPVTAFGRSRPAADASREAVERWLVYGCDVSVGHRRVPYDPFAKIDAGGTPAS